MLQIALWTLSAIGGVGLFIAAAWGLHRFCIALEERGYLYYRTRPRGGGMAGVLGELDHFVRPSIQYVEEVRDESRRKQHENEGEKDD